MMQMLEVAELNSGTPQFRIKESLNADAPTYFFFGQPEMEDDLTGIETHGGSGKQIRTSDNVATLSSGDLVFSLISGKATLVRNSHSGYLFTQNYVRLAPAPQVDAGYLVYMLNEDAGIKRQLQTTSQGSVTLKFTIRQLSDLLFPIPPPIERQRVIGELYFNQLRLAALKKRVAAAEATLLIEKLKEANKS
ncbi:MAG: restriction endonuclease subunit S [Peptococcaceae bacterium]|nr:restriction endonuclease subunit S [Peptococcaceae bacterium]